MGVTKLIITIYIIVASLCCLTIALYEDQIGKFDWKKNYIGKIKYSYFDTAKRIIVGTENNVLAAINLKTGEIIWRQILEDPLSYQLEFMRVTNEILTILSNGHTFYIRGWDLNTGSLLYEWSMHTERKHGRWIIHKDQLINVIPVINTHIEVTCYQTRTGLNKGSTSKILTPWVTDLNNCAIADTYFVCISSNTSNALMYILNLVLDDLNAHTKALNNLLGDAPGHVTISEVSYIHPAVLLTRNKVNKIVTIAPSIDILPYNLNSNTIHVPNGDINLLISIEETDKRNLELKSFEIETQLSTSITLRQFDHVKLHSGLCRGQNCRVLVTSDDESVSLVQLPSGKVQWTREEALSNIIAAYFVELPLSESDTSIENEFMEASNDDIVGMFSRRIVSQIKQLTAFINGKKTSSNNDLVRDNFGLHKIIILITKVGKLFALDSITSDIVWSTYIPNFASFKTFGKDNVMLYEQRSSRYSPLGAEITLVARHSISGNGIIYTFDPISGKSEKGIIELGFKLKQTLLLPFENIKHIKGIIILKENNEIYMYPEDAKKLLNKFDSSVYMFTADDLRSTLIGYTFDSIEQTRQARPSWNINFANSKIIALAMRPTNERVHSQGRVLADRSVFYKYINPNLVAVATIVDDPMHKHVVSIYLIDAVTGLVVHSAHHKRATEPVHIIHSENWVVYSYFSERYRRFELTAIELYEGSRQSNSTDFSSHSLSQLPHPETLSYILPAHPVSIAATLTERGITNKHLLIALSSGAVIEMPWTFIEPRGSHLATNPEEGYIPYMPELPLLTEATINYNQSLGRINGIIVSPAKLESTCLVLIHGLDLFYTRVTPSKTFDVLKEDFDHWLIIMVLVGLTLASYITKQLSIRKALKQMWK